MLNIEWLIQGTRFCMDLSINIKGCDEESSIRNNQVDSTHRMLTWVLLVVKLELILLKRKIDLEII